jgi:hypothetical protein
MLKLRKFSNTQIKKVLIGNWKMTKAAFLTPQNRPRRPEKNYILAMG